MNDLGNKIARKRKDIGLTQIEFAEKLNVTRQTVSRWEAGTVMPDIDKISDIAEILEVSCDYLLRDDVTDEKDNTQKGVSRVLGALKGKRVKLNFFEDESDIDLYNKECVIEDFEGNWMRISFESKRGSAEKLIPVSSVLSFEEVKEG
ncbi:MAG: helix-turn-helix transcriptional regulator [Anaerovoracaceae bacterium]|nr:helix-turn-helix transcriptional regulator [Anaerovoracaceae bacterium]